MPSLRTKERLLASDGAKWRKRIKVYVDSLKEHNNEAKRKECVDNVVEFLCEVIVDDRKNFPKRFKRYFYIILEFVVSLIILFFLVYVSIFITSIFQRLMWLFKSLSKDELLRLMNENSNSIFAIVITFCFVVAIIFIIVILKWLGAEKHIPVALSTFKEINVFKSSDK